MLLKQYAVNMPYLTSILMLVLHFLKTPAFNFTYKWILDTIQISIFELWVEK
jgi:hypothetical protein